MKVLFFEFGDHNTPHVETAADIIQQHLDRGDEVIRFGCQGEFPVCRFTTEHNLALCSFCVARRSAAMRLVGPKAPPLKSVLRLTDQDRQTIAAFSFDGARLSELKKVTFRSFDVGMAVASVLVDEVKDPDPDLNAHRQHVRDWIGVALAAYLSALNIFDQENPDRVYVMNGRWAETRAVLRACQARGVACHVHERGGDLKRYHISLNRLPHEIAGTAEEIEQTWRDGDPAEREAVGAAFFEEKAKGIERQWFSFVAGQTAGLMPPDWDPARRNVAVFLTSEFEHAAIGPDYTYRFYENQGDGIGRLLASLEEMDAPIHLNVRVHPNMKGIRNANLEQLLDIRSSKGTVIPPESPVSSYALMGACEKTLTFGSTMGIEAVYWGKPSVLAGPAAYQHLEGTYNPDSHEELIELLLADLAPKAKVEALKYGYCQLRRGNEHVYYQAETPFRGKFKGRYIDDAMPPIWGALLHFVYRRGIRYSSPIRLVSGWNARRLRKRIGIPTLPTNDRPTTPGSDQA